MHSILLEWVHPIASANPTFGMSTCISFLSSLIRFYFYMSMVVFTTDYTPRAAPRRP
jgi:hypothetical protein